MDYTVHINAFDGPLDLLLHLVKTKEKDIYEINTNEIIEEYINYINEMQNLNIDIASEFLIMASSLIHLKSRMLLGITSLKEEEENEFDIQSEEDLKSKIIEYEKYKNITEALKNLEEKRGEFYTKSPTSLKEFTDQKLSNDGSITIDDLIQAFLAYKERINYRTPIQTKITKRELHVEDQIVRIKDKLKEQKRMNFVDLFEEVGRDYFIVNFLAILQMSKNEEIIIYQEHNFENIVVESRENT